MRNIMDKDLEILKRIKDKYPELICSQEDTYDEVNEKCRKINRLLRIAKACQTSS